MNLKIIKNPNEDEYEKISKAVKDNMGFCPCLLYKDDTTKCMCKDFREQNYEGACHCNRYIKIKGE